MNCALLVVTVGVSAAERPPATVLTRQVIQPPAESRGRFDPSGLMVRDGQAFVVSDKPRHRHLYRLVASNQDSLRAELAHELPLGLGPELEGLEWCGDYGLMVEESRSRIIRWSVSPEGSVRARVQRLDLGGVPPIEGATDPTLWGHAGLEGVACAPDGRAWVVKERQPRVLWSVDVESARALAVVDRAATWDRPSLVEERAVWPDYSGLTYAMDADERGFLYVVERTSRAVAKLDPASGEVVDRLGVPLNEDDLYRKDDPFGLAEGIAVDEEHIWLLLDNNDDLLREGVGAGEPWAMLVQVARPEGF